MSQSQGVAKLKELLFEPESKAIADFSRRLDAVFERAGTDERLEDSVAKVLDGALRTAEVDQHDELSDAVAPLVIKTIKSEIFASRDALVEALYPMTGRMVKAYVASAINDLADQVNQRLASNPFIVGLQMITTGQSPGQIALANARPLQVEEIYLIRRGSGELLARWPEQPGSDNQDQMMSGVLTAINEFANEAFAKDHAQLRHIDMGGMQLFMRASPSYLLAAKCQGSTPKAVERIVDEAFLNAIEKHDQVLTAAAQDQVSLGHSQAMKTLAADLETDISLRQEELSGKTRKGPSPFKILLWVVGLPLLAFLAWWGYVNYETNRVRNVATSVLNETTEIRGYPTSLNISTLGRTVTVTALTPNAETQKSVVSRLQDALPKSEIVGKFSVLTSGGPDLSPELGRVRRDFAALQSRLSQDALVRAANWADRRLADSTPVLAELTKANLPEGTSAATIAGVEDAVTDVTKKLTDIREKLRLPIASDVELESLRPALAESRRDLNLATARLQAILGNERSASPETAANRVAIAGESGETNIVVVAEDLAIQAERLATVVAAVNQVVRLPKPKPVVVPSAPSTPELTPRQKLVSWTRDNAIFFISDTNYRNSEQTEATLDTLAKLVENTSSLIRVVGYTDDRGGQSRNTSLSQARAEKVRRALISRGISPDRLIAVGRNDARGLSPATGDASPNRRVEFEVGFANEKAQ